MCWSANASATSSAVYVPTRSYQVAPKYYSSHPRVYQMYCGSGASPGSHALSLQSVGLPADKDSDSARRKPQPSSAAGTNLRLPRALLCQASWSGPIRA